MEGRPAGGRQAPEPPPPHRRPPEAPPESLTVTEMKARINRDDALTRLFNNLSTLAELGADVARELLEQAEQEKAENAERRARTMR